MGRKYRTARTKFTIEANGGETYASSHGEAMRIAREWQRDGLSPCIRDQKTNRRITCLTAKTPKRARHRRGRSGRQVRSTDW